MGWSRHKVSDIQSIAKGPLRLTDLARPHHAREVGPRLSFYLMSKSAVVALFVGSLQRGQPRIRAQSWAEVVEVVSSGERIEGLHRSSALSDAGIVIETDAVVYAARQPFLGQILDW